MQTIENVQKKFVRMVSGLNGTNYEERLQELKLLTLKNRRLYFDLIETFKCIHGLSNVKYDKWFNLVGDLERRNTRGANSALNIVPNRTRLDIRENFFSTRVVPHWNNLPSEVKENRSLMAFKRNIKSFLLESQSSV